ncbi:MAG: iron-sulfur cluster assembly accessory protein [Rhodospirillales bacterium]|nr:iron-sulfur cluster assembly accessory protein [Rhodospirillales bacterium]MCB9995033.1 iron-sulfur cluster assembly accessory protein [Rhodospirillales bacterium]
MSSTYDITVDPSAIKRISALRNLEDESVFGKEALLRISVEGGGCSGFQYKMGPASGINDDDIVLDNAVVIDEISAQFLKGATIRFQTDLMAAMFVIDNPNAVSSCGCQTSFAVDPDKIG